MKNQSEKTCEICEILRLRSAHVCGSVVVFISGCFDMLHAGHVEFFQRAAALGDKLYVALGSDRTVYDLKGRPPVNSARGSVASWCAASNL